MTAIDRRRELAVLLKQAADKADEWRAAAIAGWTPLAPDYHAGDGTVTAAVEGPYMEHRLAMTIGDEIRRRATLLTADMDMAGRSARDLLSADEAIEVASRAADAFIKLENAQGRAVMYDAVGRNAIAKVGLLALEAIEPGRWIVTTTDLDVDRVASMVVLKRPGRL